MRGYNYLHLRGEVLSPSGDFDYHFHLFKYAVKKQMNYKLVIINIIIIKSPFVNDNIMKYFNLIK